MSGGRAAKLGGGKFANGAASAAFTHLFNAELSAGVPISDAERGFADSGDRKAFWESRSARGDPLGETALNILNDDGILTGQAANFFASLGGQLNGLDVDLDALGVDLMRAHIGAVDNDFHSIPQYLNAQQIQNYHWPVFESHGIPTGYYGGTLFNIPADHWLNAPARAIYCPNCDKAF